MSKEPQTTQTICDCERSHNGIGAAGRICDCPAAPLFGLKIVPSKNKTKWLDKNLGGRWKYEGRGGFFRQWRCDDGRVVRYTAPSLDEFDNPSGNSQCWIDTPGENTKAFYWSNIL